MANQFILLSEKSIAKVHESFNNLLSVDDISTPTIRLLSDMGFYIDGKLEDGNVYRLSVPDSSVNIPIDENVYHIDTNVKDKEDVMAIMAYLANISHTLQVIRFDNDDDLFKGFIRDLESKRVA